MTLPDREDAGRGRTDPATAAHARRAVFGYLLPVMAVNRGRRALRRLRDPRYALAAAAALTYFGWLFLQILETDRAVGGGTLLLPSWAGDLLPLGAAAFAAVWWVAGAYQRALAFTPPEVELLFTAPIPRRVLLQYKLNKTQPGILFTTLFLAVGLTFVPLPFPYRLASLWVLVTTAHFHQVAASLVRTSALQQGRAGLRHQALPLALFAVVTGVLVGTVVRALPGMRSAPTLTAAMEHLAVALQQPLPALLLLPFDLALAPLVATDPGEWLRWFPAALALLALHYLWLLQADTAFEEAAAEAGTRQYEIQKAVREGRGWSRAVLASRRRSRPWFALGPSGRPEVAVFWKGFLLFTRQLRVTAVLLLGGVFAAAYLLMLVSGAGSREAGGVVAGMAGMMAAVTVLLGPMATRNDLRADLRHVELLRTFPLPGSGLVAGEVAASALALSVIQAGFVALALVFVLVGGVWLGPSWMAWGSAALALAFLLPLNAVAVCGQNALALLLPAWVHLGAERAEGIEHLGADLLNGLASVVFLAVAVSLPALLGGGAYLRLRDGLDGWALLPAGIGAWTLLWLEAVVLVALLGDLYDRLDVMEAGLLR